MGKYEEQVQGILRVIHRYRYGPGQPENNVRDALMGLVTLVHTLHGEIENLKTHRLALYEITMTLVAKQSVEVRQEVLAAVDDIFGRRPIQ